MIYMIVVVDNSMFKIGCSGFKKYLSSNTSTGNQEFKLSLPLFEAGIFFVDHIQSPFSSYNFAISTAFLYGCPYFHFVQLFSISVSLLALIIYT